MEYVIWKMYTSLHWKVLCGNESQAKFQVGGTDFLGHRVTLRDRSISREYRTGKFATGPLVILGLQLDGATGYFEDWLYGATTYFIEGFQRGQRLFLSTPTRGHGLYWDFTGLSHSKITGPWQICTTGLAVILDGDFNGAMENIWPSRYGATHYSVW